ncbi:polysaccharide pyruvyl transferase family protein [Agromyces sp. NPDC058110]|uniref:polysaccharide pyruvyl transferase family protein n=1 Tax=Agromyces sp. NPDC058110 TaxID=3346345 RepID=UPI0036DC4B97
MRNWVRNAMLPVEGVIEWLVLLFVRARPGARGQRPRHVLVTGPGGGSVGDEAMYLAFVAQAGVPVTVVGRRRSDLLQLVDGDVEYVFLPNLLYGTVFQRVPQLLAFLRLARSASGVSFIGADTMDGVYNNPSSVRRFRTARQAAAVGAPTRVLGFSWNDHPTPQALREMRRTAPHVEFLMRDRSSGERIRADGALQVTDVADLAFLTTPREGGSSLEEWIADQRRLGRPIVLVNANPFLERWYPDQLSAYASVLADGLGAGVSFALIPHDTSGASNDLTYETRILEHLDASPHLFRQTALLAPADIVRIAALADAGVTGRMHFAILCAVAHTPVLALSYQGKVAGLYALLGLDSWLGPGAELAPRLRAGLDDLLSDGAARAVLEVRVPEAIALAELNLPLTDARRTA